jgi:hypothetical protein
MHHIVISKSITPTYVSAFNKPSSRGSNFYICFTSISSILLHKYALFMCLYRVQIQPNCHKTYILVILGAFYCPSGRFLSISSKSNNLSFGQLSLYLTHCAPEWKLVQTPDALNWTWDRRGTFPSLVQEVYSYFMSSMLGGGFVHVLKTCGYCSCLLVGDNRMLPTITLHRLPKYGAQCLFYRVFLNG